MGIFFVLFYFYESRRWLVEGLMEKILIRELKFWFLIKLSRIKERIKLLVKGFDKYKNI